jgi:hypothetical protein
LIEVVNNDDEAGENEDDEEADEKEDDHDTEVIVIDDANKIVDDDDGEGEGNLDDENNNDDDNSGGESDIIEYDTKHTKNHGSDKPHATCDIDDMINDCSTGELLTVNFGQISYDVLLAYVMDPDTPMRNKHRCLFHCLECRCMFQYQVRLLLFFSTTTNND